LFARVPGTEALAAAAPLALRLMLAGRTPAGQLEALIRTKEALGRDKDLLAAKELRAILEHERNAQ
jgi:hypothetical protein